MDRSRALAAGRVVMGVVGVVLGAGRVWGVPVVVRVVEKGSGKPVVGAVVARLGAVGASQADVVTGLVVGTEARRVGVTDAGGEVRLECDPAERGAYLVTAEGKGARAFGFWGCVPPTYRVELGEGEGTLRGRVFGRTDEALAGTPVRVQVVDWTLLEPVRFSGEWAPMSYGVEGRTDAEGRFEVPGVGEGLIDDVLVREGDGWRSAKPAGMDRGSLRRALGDGSFVGRVGAEGKAGGRAKVAGPATRPAVAEAALTIKLRVVDAATGKAVGRVRVTPGGSMSPDQFFRTLPRSALEVPGEGVSWSFYDAAWAYVLRVEAEGYAAAPTRVVKASERRAEVEVKLRRAEATALKVRTPGGKPAAGAEAFLATPTVVLNVPSGVPEPGDVGPFAVAGADGVLRFVPPGEPYRLAVRQESGSAEVAGTDVAAGKGEVVLTPWASVSVRIGGADRPVAGAYVQPQSAYSEDLHCPINWGGQYYSDAKGRVEIPRWRAGNFMMTAAAAGARVGWQYLEVQRKLKPGEHQDLAVLAGKTTVRGSLVEVPGYRWQQMYIGPDGPAAELPAGVNRLAKKEQAAAVEKAEKGAADPKARENVIDSMAVTPRPDGTIAVAGMGPGTYRMDGYAQATGAGGAAGEPPRIRWYFSVPATGPTVVDLGTILPAVAKESGAGVGREVPDLVADTMEGKPFSLKGNRGHYVLLDFWGTWCGFCIAEEPTLKDAYEGWGRDGRLVMVSASVDDPVEAVRGHVAKNGLGWTQVVLGPREKTDVPQRFGVEGYPEIMLISPEGKVVESGLRGVRVRDALVKYLGPPAPPRGRGE